MLTSRQWNLLIVTLLVDMVMKVFVVAWVISGSVRVMGVYTKYESAEAKIMEMRNNQIQGFYRILESEVYEN